MQQCVKQVLEPICEAKFSESSFGFRPNRAVEHAIALTYSRLQLVHLHYVIEFDIKGFFDNVNHTKLIRQIWAMGIHDKHLIYILRQMLSAPIKLENGEFITPTKGTPQGGIISPLLANIVLNELDHWVESQWVNNPVTDNYSQCEHANGTPNKGHGYRAMKDTRLKEIYIVRYADDFRIFCRNREDAERTKIAVTQWLEERLKLEVSPEKTRIVNVRRRYSNFLGFKIKVRPKKGKRGNHVVKSHVADKNLEHKRQKLLEQAKRIAKPRKERGEIGEIKLYNSIVVGLHNYYHLTTNVCVDFSRLHRAAMTVFTNRLHGGQRKGRLRRTGRELTEFERKKYGESSQMRYVKGTNEPIYPIGFVKHKNPMHRNRRICSYTADGREGLHDNLRVNTHLMLSIMRQPLYGKSAEYADNRISLFSAQKGKCAITGREFTHTAEIHCHHKTPREFGGNDKYENLALVCEPVHILIHAANPDTIVKYRNELLLDTNNRKLKERRE